MPDPIVFKCEPAMWGMMDAEDVTGVPYKPFDMRRHDMADDRIMRLSMGTYPVEGAAPAARHPKDRPHKLDPWQPDEEMITFLNTATRETVTRRYRGMEFTDWAPGWCFLLVGERLNALEGDGNDG